MVHDQIALVKSREAGRFCHAFAQLPLCTEQYAKSQIGSVDIHDGLNTLTDTYTKAVQASYHQALSLHIAALAVCGAVAFVYIAVIMLPTVLDSLHESRRVAELLAGLPSEFSAETLLQDALRPQSNTQIQPGGAD
jgi:hypothetical protein